MSTEQNTSSGAGPTPASQPNTADQRLTADERAMIANAQRQSQEQLARIGAAPQGHRPIGEHVRALLQANPDTQLKTVVVPKAFNLTLDGTAREIISFPSGTYPIPADLVGHWYAKAHGVEPYEGTGDIAPVRRVSILSSNVFAADKGISPQLVQDITLSAFTMSGMDAEAWNLLSNEQRGELMLGIYETRRRMAERAAQDHAPTPQEQVARNEQAARDAGRSRTTG